MAFQALLALTAVALSATMAVVAAQGSATSKAPSKPAAAIALPPLPNPGFAPARPMETTRMAYEFAARHPEVIKYVPCYCGCERNGHGSNESCFVRSRDAKGGVTWDSHGWGCTICIDVAVEAARMQAGGADAASIRAAIDRKYAGRFPSSTPTPKPGAHKH
jgi:Protein of unknown function with PCYCGC motif